MKYGTPISFLLLIILLASCSNRMPNKQSDSSVPTTNSVDYTSAIDKMLPVSIDDIYRMQDNNNVFYLYVGRDSCPYCEKFVTSIDPFVQEAGISLFYLDSIAPYEDSPMEIQLFRAQYGVETVPFLALFIGKDTVFVFNDGIQDGSDEEVKVFLELHKDYLS